MKIRNKYCSININGTKIHNWGGGQNFERRNVKRLIFPNSKIANIKITKNDLFDSFNIKFIFSFLEII